MTLMINQQRNQSDSTQSLLTGIQILLVEDEPDVATFLLFLLEEAGAEVTVLTEAIPALAILEELRPDVLLSNVKLPDQDGDWLIRQIRTHESEAVRLLPAVAVTSYLREVAAASLLSAGFDFFLPKLTDPDNLIATVLCAVQKEVD